VNSRRRHFHERFGLITADAKIRDAAKPRALKFEVVPAETK